MDLPKLRDYNIERAAVKLLIELNYIYMGGEIGYDNFDDLFEVDEFDWDYFKKLTGHDFYNEFISNTAKYDTILKHICHIQMVDYNKISWGINNGYRRC